MLTCKKVRKLGVALFFLYAFVLLGIDYTSLEPTYGVSIFNLIKLFIFEVILIFYYCKKVKDKSL
jgi:hypothetical protein